MAAKKGHPKWGGREAGTPNKVTSDVKLLARAHGPAIIARLAELALGDTLTEIAAVEELRALFKTKASPLDIAKVARVAFSARSEGTCVAAMKELLDRGYGKAPQPLDGDGEGGAMIVKVITGVRG